MSRIFIENMRFWTEPIELAELDKKKLHDRTN